MPKMLCSLMLLSQLGGRPRLPVSKQLSPAEERLLAERMDHHAADLDWLIDAVMFLDYQMAEEAADDVLRTPGVPRPGRGEQGTLSARLPATFFDLQDALTTKAREVREAARSRDASRLAPAAGAMVQTCVACHAAYLGEPLRWRAPR